MNEPVGYWLFVLAVVGGFAHFACFIWLWWRVGYLRVETGAAYASGEDRSGYVRLADVTKFWVGWLSDLAMEKV